MNGHFNTAIKPGIPGTVLRAWPPLQALATALPALLVHVVPIPRYMHVTDLKASSAITSTDNHYTIDAEWHQKGDKGAMHAQ